MPYLVMAITMLIVLIICTLYIIGRYKRCPSDKILVIFGNVGGKKSARCIKGGGAFVLPIYQDYSYLSLTPMNIDINLQNAHLKNNNLVNLSSSFTVAISTDEEIMNNAAEKLLNISIKDIEDLAKEIIFGQLRLMLVSLTSEEINSNRELFFENIIKYIEPKLNEIGLKIISNNVTDIKLISSNNQ